MESLQAIESDIWQKASVNREHVLAFLALQPSSDGPTLANSLRSWLQKLHDDPHFSKVNFPVESNHTTGQVFGNAIDRIVADISSYGYPTHESIIGAPPAPHDQESSDEANR